MRVERLSQDKVRIFLTFDDLLERGIEKDDMWRDIPKVHDLFNDMMNRHMKKLGLLSMDLSPWKFMHCPPREWSLL